MRRLVHRTLPRSWSTGRSSTTWSGPPPPWSTSAAPTSTSSPGWPGSCSSSPGPRTSSTRPRPGSPSRASPSSRSTRDRGPSGRNRDFLLLQAGQLLSEAGTHSAAIAYPMLVLAVTGSAAQAGVVGFARALSLTLFALPAGVVADRWNRRRLMIAADGVRVLAVGGLVSGDPGRPAPVLGDPAGRLRRGRRRRPVRGRAGRGPPRRGAGAPAAGSGRPDGPAGGGRAGRPDARRRAVRGRPGAPVLVDAVSYAFSTVSLLAM